MFLGPAFANTASADTTSLTDGAGVNYLFQENVAASDSLASGAMFDAAFPMPMTATTMAGGPVVTTLADAYDGYHSFNLSTSVVDTAFLPNPTVRSGVQVYTDNGAHLATPCGPQEIAFPAQLMHGVFMVERRIFVPADDAFARYLDSVTNTSGSAQTVYVGYRHNLGSDSNTLTVTTSSGDAEVTSTDLWATTFQNFVAGASTDPRLGHVFQGEGVVDAPLFDVRFTDGNDLPYWWYSITIAPGQTARLLTYAVVERTKARAAAKSAELAHVFDNPHALQCLSATELLEIRNFAVSCGMLCDDGNDCTDDVCSAGSCVHTPSSVGSCAMDAGAVDAGAVDGGEPDGASTTDAAMFDAAELSDAAQSDATTTEDGATATDASEPRDMAIATDATITDAWFNDAATTPQVDRPAGCGCDIPGSRRNASLLSMFAALGVLVGAHRVARRRRRPSELK